MEENEDGFAANVVEATVTVSVPSAGETLVETLNCGDQVGASLSEGDGACDGEDIMVEVLGSDVFVDGVGGEAVRGDSNEETGRGGLIEVGLEREAKSVDEGGGVGDDVMSQGVVVLGGEVWKPKIEGGVGGSSAVAGSSEHNQVHVAEKAEVMASEEAAERGRESGDGVIDVVADLTSHEVGVVDNEARNHEIDVGVEGSLVVVGSSACGEQNQVEGEKVLAMVAEEDSERGLVKEGEERVGASADGRGDAVDDLTSQIEDVVECSSVSMESSNVPTQVLVEEASVMVREGGLNTKNKVQRSDVPERNISCIEKDQISVVDTVHAATERDDIVFADSGSANREPQVTGGGAVQVIDKEEILHSKVESMETNAVDGNLHCSAEDQQLNVETVGRHTENCGEACAGPDSNHKPTEYVAGGEVAALENNVALKPNVEVPKIVDLDGTLSLSGNNQNLKVDSCCGATEKHNQIPGKGEIAVVGDVFLKDHLSSEEDQLLVVEPVGGTIGKDGFACADSGLSIEQTQAAGGDDPIAIDNKDSVPSAGVIKTDGLSEILACSENNQNSKVDRIRDNVNADPKSIAEPTRTAERGDVLVVEDKDALISRVEVHGVDALHGAGSVKDQELKVVIMRESTEGDVFVCADHESSGEQTKLDAFGGVAAMENKGISSSKSEDSNAAALEESVAGSENDQKLKANTAFGGIVSNNTLISDLESSDEQNPVVGVGEKAAMEVKRVFNSRVEAPVVDAFDGNLCCSVKDQDLKANTVSGSTGKDGFAHADPRSSVDQNIVVKGEIAMINDEVSKSQVEVLGENMCCFQKDDASNAVSMGGSTEKDGVGHKTMDSSAEQTKIAIQVESPMIDNKGTSVSKLSVLGNDALCGSLCHHETVLKVDVVDGSTDKDHFVCVDPNSCKEISDSKVEALGCNALDGNVSFSEKDLGLNIETVAGSPKKDGAVNVDPSVQVGSPPIGDCSSSVIGKKSDILEDNMPMQDEKQETIVQPAETLTVGVDRGQSKNHLFVEETSSQVACISGISDSVVDVAVGPQAALNSAAFHNKGDCSSFCVTDLPDGNQDLEIQVVSYHTHLPDGDHANDTHVSDMETFHEVENQVAEAKNESSKADETHVLGDFVPEAKVSHSSDNGSMTLSGEDGNCKSQDDVVRENISPPDESPHEGTEIQGMGVKEGFPVSDCLDQNTAFHPPQVGSSGGKEVEAEAEAEEQIIEAEEQIIDAEGFDLHGGEEMQAEEQPNGSEQPKSIEEKIGKRGPLKAGSSARMHQATFELSPEPEGEFSVSDLVWGKVRSHPWWPGQIFDPSDSSEKAMKYHKKDCYLVAYFGDRTFAWNEASLLKPFRTHFSQIEKHSSSEAFHNAVNCALDEVSRRVELGLACFCIPKEAYDKIKYQIVQNTGIRQESNRRDGVDKSASVNSFEPAKLVEYINALAQFPSGGGDRLELVIAKAQLLAFNRFKGYNQLPEFQFCGGLLENYADMPLSGYRMHSSEVIEHSAPPPKDDELVSSAKGKLKGQNSSSNKRKHNLKDSMYPRKKERSLFELMGGAPYSPDDEDESDLKASSKLVSSSTGKKRRAVDSFADDSTVQDRRKSIMLAKVSQTTPPSHKQSFKVGECISRVASQLTRSPSFLKSTSERLQKVDGSDDKTIGADFDVSVQIPDESSSLDEMLSQLHLAAQDPMKGYSFLTSIIDFFSDYRNSIVTSGRENLSMDKASGGRKKKSSHPIIGSPEAFEFEDMNDSYWTDRIIQNSSEEQPSRRGRKRRGEYQLVTVEPEDSRLYGNHEMAAEKLASYDDERKQDLSPTELILNFAEVDFVPSETNLNKMFRRFGPLRESETEVDRPTSRARVVFKRCSDAEVAFSSAGKFHIFGPTVVNYQLSYSPSISFKSSPLAITEGQEDAT